MYGCKIYDKAVKESIYGKKKTAFLMSEVGIIRCTYLKNEILLRNIKGNTIKFFGIYHRKIS